MPRHSNCTCIDRVNKALAEHNTEVVSNLLNNAQVFLAVEKIDSSKRGKAKSVIATFCPFCGRRIHPSRAQKQLRGKC